MPNARLQAHETDPDDRAAFSGMVAALKAEVPRNFDIILDQFIVTLFSATPTAPRAPCDCLYSLLGC